MSFNLKVRIVQILNHIMVAFGAYYLYTHPESIPLWLPLCLFSFLIFGILGANIGMHRLVAHRSFKTQPWIEKTLSLIGVLTTMGSPMSWAIIHRYHHSHSDQPQDPHSPHHIGDFSAWVGLWNYQPIPARYAMGIYRDSFQVFLHRHYFKILLGFVCMLALVHPLAVIFVYAIPASGCLLGSSMVSVLCHRFGYRLHQTTDQSYNNPIASLFSLGEGWHNSHHRYPNRVRQGTQWWELDPSAWIIENLLIDEKVHKTEPSLEINSP